MSIIIALSIFISLSLFAAVFAYATWPKRISDDVMMQIVGDAPHIEGRG